jgi:RNA polymerase sigma factor (TIGR02999 family)
MDSVTQLLAAAATGDEAANARFLAVVYRELRQLAAAKMAREQPGQTLQPTALVHEAWLKLVDRDGHAHFENRLHFFGAAAEAMRRILVDRARRRRAARHGAGHRPVDLDDLDIAAPAKDDEIVAVHEALDRLATHDSRKAALVKLRYFSGLSIDETAELLGISAPTAKRDWLYARAWLFREMTAMTCLRSGGTS